MKLILLLTYLQTAKKLFGEEHLLSVGRMVPREQYLEILSDINVEKKFFEQWVLREAYIKWTGEGLSRDMRTISMDEGSHMLLDMEDGYSGAVWAMNPMEINWKYEDIILG